MNALLKLLSSVKDSYIPAFFVLIASFFCALNIHLQSPAVLSINIIFFLCCLANIALLFYLKDFKNLFFTLILLFLYFALAKQLQSPFVTPTVLKRWLMLLMPLNLFLISSVDQKENHAFWFLCFFLAQAALLENLCLSEYALLPDFFIPVSQVLWVVLFLYLLVSVSIYPSIKNSACFFEALLIFAALYYFQYPHLFLICLLAAILTSLTACIYHTVYSYFKDEVTGVYSQNSFPALDPKKLPGKYSIAFFCIDNYRKILQVFKRNLTDKLTVMVLKRILTFKPDARIYRLKEDEFCLIFLGQDIKQTYDLLEDMRRLVAGTEFVLKKNKVLKITITPVVAEKHRNDANAAVVLDRMHKNFDARYKFTQNITFCEELEQTKKAKRTAGR